MGLETGRLILLSSAAAMVLLGTLLAAIDFEKRVNRAFAALLGVRGLSLLLLQLSDRPSWNMFAARFQPYLALAILPLALYFASMYPRRRGPLARRGAGWVVLGAILVLDAIYFMDHSLYYTVAPGEPSSAAMRAAAGVQYTGFGPLATLPSLAFPLFSMLSLLFVWDYTRTTPGATRTSYFLVASGFLLNGLFDGASRLIGLFHLLGDPGGFAWAPWGWAIVALPASSLVPAVAALALVAAHRFRGRGGERPMEARLYVAAFLALLTGLFPLVLAPGSDFFRHPATLILLGLWRLTLPALVTFALLRYALFDIDLKVRAAVAWSVVVGILGATYFLVSELLEGVVASRTGTLGGLAAAALLTLAAKPLSVIGRRAAALLMPGTKDLASAPRGRAQAIYLEQFLMLQEDGVLTEKERRSLEGLRERLGIGQTAAAAIERRAMPGAGSGRVAAAQAA